MEFVHTLMLHVSLLGGQSIHTRMQHKLGYAGVLAQRWSLKHNKNFSRAFASSSPIRASIGRGATQDDEHISFTFHIYLVSMYIHATDVIEHVQETKFTISLFLLSRTVTKTIPVDNSKYALDRSLGQRRHAQGSCKTPLLSTVKCKIVNVFSNATDVPTLSLPNISLNNAVAKSADPTLHVHSSDLPLCCRPGRYI